MTLSPLLQNLTAPDSTMSKSTAALKELQAQEQGELLNKIDSLRNLGIQHEVDFPQLIVCGDTSAGKSSVLEAISTVPFPKKDNVSTRFATEISLRPSQETHAIVEIYPDENENDEYKDEISSFKRRGCDLSRVDSLIEQAAEAMGVDNGNPLNASKSFSNDILKLRIYGPDLPSLTLVDLPGFIHTSNQEGGSRVVQQVHDLVERYMKKERSIILAVITASSPISNQIVLAKAQEYDPHGLRTMGILTKLDVLSTASESRPEFLSLARNDMDKYRFQLGWHALRNATPEERAEDGFDRDRVERLFFAKAPWKDSLPEESKGVKALRKRLSTILFNHIRTELPGLVQELKKKHEESDRKVKQLKPARDTSEKQKDYLRDIAVEFQHRTRQAIDGNYAFRLSLLKNTTIDPRHLRAVIRRCNEEFADETSDFGHTYHITKDMSDGAFEAAKKTHYTDKSSQSLDPPQLIRRTDFIEKVILDVVLSSHGCELPGLFDPLLVGAIFRLQSVHWHEIADAYLKDVMDVVNEFLTATISDIAEPEVAVNIQELIFEEALEQKEHALKLKLEELLIPFQRRHPATMNPRFRAKLDKERRLHVASTSDPDSDISTHDWAAGVEILNYMCAYYSIARNVFVDNVVCLAVESCLLGDLDSILSVKCVEAMAAGDIERCVQESDQTRRDREYEGRKLKELKAALDICKRYEKRVPHSLRNPTTVVHDDSGIVSNQTVKSEPKKQAPPTLKETPPSDSSAQPTATPKGGQRFASESSPLDSSTSALDTSSSSRGNASRSPVRAGASPASSYSTASGAGLSANAQTPTKSHRRKSKPSNGQPWLFPRSDVTTAGFADEEDL